MSQVAVKEGLFTMPGNALARLLGGHCAACARFHFPAQGHCPYCCASGCDIRELSRDGIIEVCTTVTNRPPGYEGPMPFGFGVVELPEGIRLISRICPPGLVTPGTPVSLMLDVIAQDREGRDIVTYAFTARKV